MHVLADNIVNAEILPVASQRDISATHVFLMSLYYELTAPRSSNVQPKNNGASSHPIIMVMLSNVLTESKHIS